MASKRKEMDQKHTYHEEKVFEILGNWQRADVPDYFETRILARVQPAMRRSGSLKWGWATLAVVLLVNGFAAMQYVKKSKSDNESVYKQYLESSHDIYTYYPAS